MRSIWNGAIGFGLVNIPVKMYSATESSTLDLDMLDKKDHSNIRFKRVNEKTGKEVDWENIVKAYKIDDRYIVLDDEDFEAASPEKSKVLSPRCMMIPPVSACFRKGSRSKLSFLVTIERQGSRSLNSR